MRGGARPCRRASSSSACSAAAATRSRGVTANPAVGFCTDLLVRAGATVMFSRGDRGPRRHRPAHRRAPPTPEVAEAMIREMAWYDAYLGRGQRRPQRQHDAGQQEGRPVQHRREGDGLDRQDRLARRSRACCRRARSSDAAEGLIYAATPASDFICGTLQLAAGMNLHVFTTGRGTPYGLAAVPVIKVATRSDLARRWHDLMDINAGTHRRRHGDDRGRRLGAVPADAGGRERHASRPGPRSWKLHNALVLFNPAPVT